MLHNGSTEHHRRQLACPERHIPHAGLLIAPMTGHTVNIEEPGLFKGQVGEFLTSVENGRWGTWKGRGR